MNAEIDISSVTLKTERLILRPWTLDDVDDLYAYASVEGVGEWAGWLPHKSKDESRKIVESFIRHKKVFAIEYQGKVIGTLGFEEYREAESHNLPSLGKKRPFPPCAGKMRFYLCTRFHSQHHVWRRTAKLL